MTVCVLLPQLTGDYHLEVTVMCVVTVSADVADDYYVAGMAMAVSLVHEGPAPAFFSKELYSAIVAPSPAPPLLGREDLSPRLFSYRRLRLRRLSPAPKNPSCVQRTNCLKL